MSVINKYMSYMKSYSAVDITFMCILNKQKICKIGGGGIWCWFSYFKNKKIKIYFTNLWLVLQKCIHLNIFIFVILLCVVIFRVLARSYMYEKNRSRLSTDSSHLKFITCIFNDTQTKITLSLVIKLSLIKKISHLGSLKKNLIAKQKIKYSWPWPSLRRIWVRMLI